MAGRGSPLARPPDPLARPRAGPGRRGVGLQAGPPGRGSLHPQEPLTPRGPAVTSRAWGPPARSRPRSVCARPPPSRPGNEPLTSGVPRAAPARGLGAAWGPGSRSCRRSPDSSGGALKLVGSRRLWLEPPGPGAAPGFPHPPLPEAKEPRKPGCPGQRRWALVAPPCLLCGKDACPLTVQLLAGSTGRRDTHGLSRAQLLLNSPPISNCRRLFHQDSAEVDTRLLSSPLKY